MWLTSSFLTRSIFNYCLERDFETKPKPPRLCRRSHKEIRARAYQGVTEISIIFMIPTSSIIGCIIGLGPLT